MTKTISHTDLDFSQAKPVISGAQKFIIPVGAYEDADPLVYPEGEKKGTPITDWQGKPIGDKGIVFFNEKDKSYQAARADGKSVIILNEVDEVKSKALHSFAKNLGESVDNLSKSSLEVLLHHARTELGLGDMYNSDDGFIKSKMTKVHNGAPDTERPSGLMKRDDRDICQAVHISGPSQFQGPAATPQQVPVDGAFVVKQGEGEKASFRVVQSDVFVRTYLNADGSKIEKTGTKNSGSPAIKRDI